MFGKKTTRENDALGVSGHHQRPEYLVLDPYQFREKIKEIVISLNETLEPTAKGLSVGMIEKIRDLFDRSIFYVEVQLEKLSVSDVTEGQTTMALNALGIGPNNWSQAPLTEAQRLQLAEIIYQGYRGAAEGGRFPHGAARLLAITEGTPVTHQLSWQEFSDFIESHGIARDESLAVRSGSFMASLVKRSSLSETGIELI